MRQNVVTQNISDQQGNPLGGSAEGIGLKIEWQAGPIGQDGSGINGAFVEDVLEACIGRLKFYQDSRYSCDYNARAMEKIREALDALDARTLDRKNRHVEGTNAV